MLIIAYILYWIYRIHFLGQNSHYRHPSGFLQKIELAVMKFYWFSKRFDFCLYCWGKRAKFDNISHKQNVIAFLRKNIQFLQICTNVLIFRDIVKKSGEKVYFSKS